MLFAVNLPMRVLLFVCEDLKKGAYGSFTFWGTLIR
jgi:hypothetical protein